MKRARYTVIKTGRMIDSATEVFQVRIGQSFPTDVWRYPDGKCRCVACSGPLSAMLTTCQHARAVRRFNAKK